ncbi:hypothetical protein [Vibrio sp.]|uniref:hypothetical protein n=1 Tax=Vibrio sp. TaxID=678 RepID=UPI00311FDACB
MKLYLSKGEVLISGDVLDLQNIRACIEKIKDNDMLTFTFLTDANPAPYDFLERNLIVRATSGPANASFIEGEGVIVEGSKANLDIFASYFDFDVGTAPGCHYHWDEACGADCVAAGTLPIVVAVAGNT